jgi:hypothetical protein
VAAALISGRVCAHRCDIAAGSAAPAFSLKVCHDGSSSDLTADTSLGQTHSQCGLCTNCTPKLDQHTV